MEASAGRRRGNESSPLCVRVRSSSATDELDDGGGGGYLAGARA